MNKSILISAVCLFAVYISYAQDGSTADYHQGSFIDERDGQEYKWVKIGDQTWMAENLNFGMMGNERKWMNKNTIVKLCYDNNENNCDIFGGLYLGYIMDQFSPDRGPNGICPPGWHVPSDDEWQVLTDYQGGKNMAGGSMKEAGTVLWDPPNTGANNSSGFTALPGGYFDIGVGRFVGKGKACFFWSSTFSWAYPISGFSYWNRNLNRRNTIVRRNMGMQSSALSVRCIKD